MRRLGGDWRMSALLYIAAIMLAARMARREYRAKVGRP
jgi:hypothetical protein